MFVTAHAYLQLLPLARSHSTCPPFLKRRLWTTALTYPTHFIGLVCWDVDLAWREVLRQSPFFHPAFHSHLGNEPDILEPFQFNVAGRADLTQKYSRAVMAQSYNTQPHGVPGNDDYGCDGRAVLPYVNGSEECPFVTILTCAPPEP